MADASTACDADQTEPAQQHPVDDEQSLVDSRRSRGQTMTEYALLLATIAAILVSLYRTSGTIVQALLNTIDNSL